MVVLVVVILIWGKYYYVLDVIFNEERVKVYKYICMVWVNVLDLNKFWII